MEKNIQDPEILKVIDTILNVSATLKREGQVKLYHQIIKLCKDQLEHQTNLKDYTAKATAFIEQEEVIDDLERRIAEMHEQGLDPVGFTAESPQLGQIMVRFDQMTEEDRKSFQDAVKRFKSKSAEE